MRVVAIVERHRDGARRKILGYGRQQPMQIDNRASFRDDLEVLLEQFRQHRQVEGIVGRGLDAVIEEHKTPCG